ncbi:MAG: phosphoribosylamine--glycine ligase [Vicinamibacterales bacterium]|nr:phosphoribosylamine--glycine ligase [Vicinamibacterales bacterium]
MKILIVGGGAREHALAWKLSAEHPKGQLVCAPGNPGMAAVATCIAANPADPEELFQLAEHEAAELTVVGPEVPLANGVADRFASGGRLLFGPTQAAARLESSKAFAKAFMARHGIPTAECEIHTEASGALNALRSGRLGYPVVIKADGLAAGKGVIIAPDSASAEQAIREMLVDQRFGAAGATVVIEEHLEGEEASFFALCDGQRAMALPSAQDHKRAFDNDQGPNTGGMGAFAPTPRMTDEIRARVVSEIVEPVLAGMAADGHPYVGVLYVGLMLTADGPKVIEFNVRFGDPEAQVVLPLVAEDLTPLLVAAAQGRLSGRGCVLRTEPHVGVVAASGGYPGSHSIGLPITGIEAAAAQENVLVFHASTKRTDAGIVTAGGRVLTVVGRGATFAAAIDLAYAAAALIKFDGMHIRTDIGRMALTLAA